MQHLFLTFAIQRVYQLLMPLFTKENAAILGRKGAVARWTPKPPPAEPPAMPSALADTLPDHFADKLTGVCDQTLDLISKSKEPIHRAQLARALRDLRETWHLATGKPRPGLTRPEMGKSNRTQMPRVYPGVYNPPGGNTGNPGSTT